MRTTARYLLIAAGFLAVGFAALGIFLPVLPTTPFLLLAAFFFARSSPRFYRWLHTNRWFGTYLTDYREGRGMPLREKVLTLAALWLTIMATVVFALSSWIPRVVLLLIASAVSFHLVRIPTYRRPPQGMSVADPASDPQA